MLAALQSGGGGDAAGKEGGSTRLDVVVQPCRDEVRRTSLREEAADLLAALQTLRGAERLCLDGCGRLPFDGDALKSLRAVIQECDSLQRYAETGIERMPKTVCAEVTSMAGESYTVEVMPGTESVLDLKKKLADRYGQNAYALELYPEGAAEVSLRAQEAYQKVEAAYSRALMERNRALEDLKKVEAHRMQNAVLLYNYNVYAPLTMVVSSREIQDELLRLTFDNPDDLGFDCVSSMSGRFTLPSEKVPVAVDGRAGCDIRGHCVLWLGTPISLGDEWTISVWTLAPITPKGYRNLLDDTGDNNIVVCITQGRIGDYNNNSYINFDPATLEAGWHHIAAVGCNGSVTYYIDGDCTGHHETQAHGRISTIGNRGDGHCSESWGVMSDLRIFGSAAKEEQIQFLYHNG